MRTWSRCECLPSLYSTFPSLGYFTGSCGPGRRGERESQTSMASMSLQNLKTASMLKDAEEKRRDNREKAMLLFAFQLLLDKGYVDTATSLAGECSLNLEQYTICENIDLNSIFIEFETYYNLRYQRFPQYFKKTASPNGSSENLLGKLRCRKGSAAAGVGSGKLSRPVPNNSNNETNHANKILPASHKQNVSPEAEESSLAIQGYSSPSIGSFDSSNPFSYLTNNGEKLIKPISGLDFLTDDARAFAEMIQREIVVTNFGTKYDDVIGLEDAKTILQESLVYNREFQEFFGTALPPWKGLLLYGPPGTGKTLLAKAVATECGSTFFNISSSTIVSKWRGDSEKIVKVLFHLARYHAPSTIFFDEFDAIGSRRDTGESEAARRLKSEILQRMDGLLAESFCGHQEDQKPIFILAATNLPWDLDHAILRRLEKRIYVPLPNKEERIAIFHLYFSRTAESVAKSSRQGRHALLYQLDLDALALATDGYSGSDVHQVVKESVVRKFRENINNKIKKLLITTEDVLRVIQSIPCTVKSNLKDKYSAWESGYGAA